MYERMGFVAFEPGDGHPGLRGILDEELRLGVSGGRRVAMRKELLP